MGLGGGHGKPGGDDGGVEEGDISGTVHGSGPGGLVGGAAGEIEQWGRWWLRVGGEEALEGRDWTEGRVGARVDDQLVTDPVLIVLGHLDGEDDVLAVVVGRDELDVAAGGVRFGVKPRALGGSSVLGHAKKSEEEEEDEEEEGEEEEKRKDKKEKKEKKEKKDKKEKKGKKWTPASSATMLQQLLGRK